MLGSAWSVLKATIYSFLDNGGLSRGAAIAFYAVTSIGPGTMSMGFCELPEPYTRSTGRLRVQSKSDSFVSAPPPSVSRRNWRGKSCLTAGISAATPAR